MCLALPWGGSTPQLGAELKLQISRKWVELGASLSWLPRQGASVWMMEGWILDTGQFPLWTGICPG